MKKIFIGLFCMALTLMSFLQSNTKPSLNMESLLRFSEAQAEYCSWGYKKNNCGRIYGDGVDCDCMDRTDVCRQCDDNES